MLQACWRWQALSIMDSSAETPLAKVVHAVAASASLPTNDALSGLYIQSSCCRFSLTPQVASNESLRGENADRVLRLRVKQ